MPRPRKRLSDGEPQPTYDAPPTTAEWNSMKSYGSFTILDHDQRPHVFHIGDNIFVLPTLPDKESSNLPDEDLWIAKIDAIRAQASHNAWMRVQWYYHPDELSSSIKSFQSRFCGTRERILSTHYDLIPTISCNGEVNVVEFKESVTMDDIPEDTFYYRLKYHVKRQGKRPAKKLITPFTLSCFCREPYGPDLHIMRLCIKCERWFHKDCLKLKPPINKSPNQMAHICHPPEQQVSDVSELHFSSLSTREQTEILSAVRMLAQQPVARGKHFGVSGNCRYVCRARHLLNRLPADSKTCTIPPDWKQYLGLSSGREKPCTEAWRICPTCGSSI